MTLRSSMLGVAAGTAVAVAFALCGILFAIAPGPMSAAAGWILHTDIVPRSAPISITELIAGIAFVAVYFGLIVAGAAALYNRLAVPQVR